MFKSFVMIHKAIQIVVNILIIMSDFWTGNHDIMSKFSRDSWMLTSYSKHSDNTGSYYSSMYYYVKVLSL